MGQDVIPLFIPCFSHAVQEVWAHFRKKNRYLPGHQKCCVGGGKKIAWKLFLSLKSLLVGAGNLQTEGVGVCGGQERPEGGKRKKHLSAESLPGR